MGRICEDNIFVIRNYGLIFNGIVTCLFVEFSCFVLPLSQTRIINDVLDLSKIEAGKTRLEHFPLNLSHLMIDLVRTHQLSAAMKGVRLEAQMAHDVPHFIFGDIVRFRQLLINLISNASMTCLLFCVVSLLCPSSCMILDLCSLPCVLFSQVYE